MDGIQDQIQENQNQENQGENQNQESTQDLNTESSWRDDLPPELKSAKTLEKFKDVANLAKSYLEAEKNVSRKGVILPTEKSTPEEWNNYYKTIGRPEKADDYKLVNEGVEVDENLQKAILPMFHEAGLTNKQAQILNDKWNGLQSEQKEQMEKDAEQYRDKSAAEFKKEWGNKFDVNLKKADDAGQRVFGPDFMQALAQTGLANHPAVIKGLFKLSSAIGEHSFTASGRSEGSKSDVTWEKLLSMKQDPKYWDAGRRDPNYVKEVEAANKQYADRQGA